MQKLTTYLVILLLLQTTAQAQRINFKPFVQDENITVTVVDNPAGLNFNNKQSIIVAGDPSIIEVDLMDNAAVVVEIEAPLDYDLTLEFTGLNRLSIGGLDTGITVPFHFNFAYNNTGETSDASRRLSAISVPSGFTMLTLPVRRRQAGGPPGPPPTPDHAGYTRPRGSVYVYIFGSLGPAPAAAPTGDYSTTLELYINFSDNAF